MMSIVGLILVAQAAAVPAGQAVPPLPDVELHARADIRSLKIRSEGTATLTFRADPGDAPPVAITRSAPAGASDYRNLRIALRGFARLNPPGPIAAIRTTTGESE